MPEPLRSEHAEAFLHQKDASVSTLRNYRTNLRVFEHHLGGRPCHSATTAEIREFRQSMRAEGRPSHTIAARMSAIRSFFAWAKEVGRLDEDPAEVIGPGHPRPRVVPVLTSAEVRRLESHRWTFSHAPERDKAMALVFVHAGLKQEEARDLDWTDIAFDRKVLSVRGGRHRIGRQVPICSVLLDALAAWRSRAPKVAAVFVRESTQERLSRASIHERIRVASEALGIPALSANSLRLTFLAALRRKGRTLAEIADVAGFANEQATWMSLRRLPTDVRGRPNG